MQTSLDSPRAMNWLSRLAPVPLWLLVLAMIGLRLIGGERSYESLMLLRVLTTIFITITSSFIAVLAARTFLADGKPAVLMLGCAMAIWGLSALVAIIATTVGNSSITIHNIGVACSAACHMAGALLAHRSTGTVRNPANWLAISGVATVAIVGLIWLATSLGWLPPFFIDGQGGTRTRTFILSLAVTSFACTAGLIWMAHRRSGSEFMRWYALGLGLVAAGMLGLIMQRVLGSALGWTARSTQYLGGLYMLAGVIFALRESKRGHIPLAIILERANEVKRLLDLTHDAIIVRNQNDDVVYWNHGAEILYGYSRTQALGQNARRLMQTEFPGEEKDVIAAAQRDGYWAGELVHTTHDGKRIHVESRWALDTDASGRISFVLEINHDISDWKLAQDALRASAEREHAVLREADRRKDEFLTLLAHELRNPLAAIRYGVELLRMQGLSADQSPTVDVLDQQGQQLGRLVDDLLDVSRITRNKLKLRDELVNLSDALARAVSTSRPHIDEAKHELNVRLPSEPLLVRGDFIRLAQVFTNLLNNAAKYTPRGGRIELAALREDGQIIVRVQDTGIGIGADMLPRIFTMFSQAEGHLDRAQGGLGIGLALAKQLVEMQGGTIEARSDGENQGSEFIVRLPVAEAREQNRSGLKTS